MKIKLLYLSIVLLAFLRGANLSAQNVPPIAAFAYDPGIDTIWINSPYRFVNTSSGDSRVYWDIREITGTISPFQTRVSVPDTGEFILVTTNHANFDYTFIDTGLYRVSLLVANNFGLDSVSKIVYVSHPTQKPKANFFVDRVEIGQGEAIPMYDISSNGPTQWEWYLTPRCFSCGDPNVIENYFWGGTTKYPTLIASEGGTYSVCLVVRNTVGADTLCKKDYINIRAGKYMNRNLEDTISTLGEGFLYDNGGPGMIGDPGNYYTMQGNFPVLQGKTFTLAPCASSITLHIEQFKFRNQDSIILREATLDGPVIARLGGTLKPNQSRTLVSTTGKIVFEWKVGAGNTTPNDSGFIFRYTSTPATYGMPNAYFEAPDVVYSGYNIKYINKTQGQGNLTFAWDADGQDLGNSNPLDDTGFEFFTKDGANWTFLNTGFVPNFPKVCMIAANCKGQSMYCKTIEVRPIVTAPIADFTTPRTDGFTTDVFELQDLSVNGVSSWEWTFTPNTVTYQNGTTRFSQNPIFKLNYPGNYTVKLKSANPIGADSIEKFLYFKVISYSSAGTANPIGTGSDIGITKVAFANVNSNTAAKTPVYDTLYNSHVATLYRGVKYPIEVHRPTALTGMTRKIWIDLNLDGDFSDAGELIYSETNTYNLVANTSFQLPNNIEPGRRMRLRVGVSEGESSLSPDRSESGCFEDYGILVGTDNFPPQIWLNGDSIVRIEINKSFIDEGVTAIDNHEADISHKYMFIDNIELNKVGFYTRKYFVHDLYGNVSDTVYRTVQVEINREGPTLSLNAPDSVFIKVQEDILTSKIAQPTAVSNLGAPLDSKLITRFGFVDSAVVGNYSLGWAIKDEFSYVDTIYQRFYVRDVTAPEIWVVNDVNNTRVINHQVGQPYRDEAIGYKDNYYVNNADLTLSRIGTVNVNTEGSTANLIYTVCDPSGNCSAPFNVLVNVKDAISPTIELRGENPMKVDVRTSLDKIKLEDASNVEIKDNFYPVNSLILIRDYSAVNPYVLGTYPVKYTVRDGAGNQTVATRYVQIVDRQSPVIDLMGPSYVKLYYRDTFVDPGFRLLDNYYSEASLLPNLKITTTLGVVKEGNESYFVGSNAGIKEVRYNLTDSSGNIANQVVRVVEVIYASGLLENKTNGELNVYPNPNKGVFTFSTKEPLKGKTDVSIYNVLGAKVFNEVLEDANATTHTIRTSGLKSGVYVISVNNNGSQFTQRLVIE